MSWHLSDDWIGTLTRVDTFRPDPQVPPDRYRVSPSISPAAALTAVT